MSKGFTLIETVLVMVIVAILAAFVAVRMNPFDTIKLNSATRKISDDIRYAQKLAVTTQQLSAVAFNSPSQYTIYQNYSSGIANSPGDICSTDASNKFVVDFTSARCSNYEDVTITPSVAVIAFNSIGALVDGSNIALPDQSLSVVYKGSSSAVTIYNGTGRVSY